MVEYVTRLDDIFYSLSDPTRRDILERVGRCEQSVGELAAGYRISLAAISKHIKVLQQARLIKKRRDGRRTMVAIVPGALDQADHYLERYRQQWQDRHDSLQRILDEGA